MFGFPYKGSKNRLANDIVELLPCANTLYDLFAGGCAITHCAMRVNRYNDSVIERVFIPKRQKDLYAVLTASNTVIK